MTLALYGYDNVINHSVLMIHSQEEISIYAVSKGQFYVVNYAVSCQAAGDDCTFKCLP
jgi:hypothetical protein